jgi:hypothetical protein
VSLGNRSPGIPELIQARIQEEDSLPWQEWKNLPEFSHKWLIAYLKRQKSVPTEELEAISAEPSFIHHYEVISALVKRRGFPPALFLRFAETLRWGDILSCLRLPYISMSAKTTMIQNLIQRYPFFTIGERITIAKRAPQILVSKLRTESEPKIIQALINNPNFSHTDALFIASNSSLPVGTLSLLSNTPKWIRFKDVRLALLKNPSTPRSCYRGLLACMERQELKAIQADYRVPRYAKILAEKLRKVF